jgi:subtilisin family serine protease
MNKITLVSLLSGFGLFLAQTLSFAGVAFPLAGGNQYVPNQILVKFKPGVAAAARAQMAQTYGAQAMQTLGNQPDFVLANLTPGQTVEQAVSAYSSDPNVAYAQPNYIYHALAVPGPTPDPQYGQLWAVKNTGQSIATGTYPAGVPVTGTAGDDMNLESAWNVQTDCSTVVVAVVDSGINYNSTDLTNSMWSDSFVIDTKHGRNFAPDATTGAGSDPMDLMGHGTHVAGIIGAVGGNGIGGVGVCWKASLMAVRVLDATGSGTTATISSGIDYAVDHGAQIINMSLGGGGASDPAFSAAIDYAQTHNVLVVVAAGNDGANNDTAPHWPCNFPQTNLICVAALDQNYALASFSDWGATSVDVGAPGTNIYSTWAGTNAVITDFHVVNFPTVGTLAVAPTSWSGSSTTTGTGGGWGGTSGGFLLDPANINWGTSTVLYNANTDDRAYKTFNLTGVNVAFLEVYAAIDVRNGDYFNVNYTKAGGDPFAGGGTNVAAVTNWHGGTNAYPTGQIDITPCISATCTVGFQLTSAPTSVRDIGVAMTNFTITTLSLNTTSYNTIDGTSMATPEVAGVAALVWAHNPQYTYTDVANAIKKGGRPISALSGKTTTGNAVDAMGSLAYINPPTGIAVVVH